MGVGDDAVRLRMGRLMGTPGVLELVPRAELLSALERHQRGDWGEVQEQDKWSNNAAQKNGGRILSAYSTAGGTKFWIITEADRSYTICLLPSEY